MPPTAKLIADWDAGASRYDALTAPLERRFMAPSRRWVTERASGEVLEVGVGTGANLGYYATEVRLTGLDWSSGMLNIARDKAERLTRPVELRQGDASELPFEDASFDAVVASFVLCSVPDPRAALREGLRVLRPGGRLLLADHVAAHWPLRALQHLVEWVTGPRSGEYWTRRPLVALRDLDASIVETRRTTFGALECVHAQKP
ncbi:MAG: methyltransferase domain-containing protein [Propionibacteriaceae bacterium]|nr:methyltransferase domain-containing protein [Propionibacteriaceae bacterium]